MANVVVVGSQWGDEGKGKIVDWLSEQADIVVRFQGGHNAGHTLVIDGTTYKLSLLPSGVVRPGKLSVIGNGVVIDPRALLEEIDRLKGQGVDVTPQKPAHRRERHADPAAAPGARRHSRILQRAHAGRHHPSRHRPGLRGQGRPARHPGQWTWPIRWRSSARSSGLLIHHNALRRGLGLEEVGVDTVHRQLAERRPARVALHGFGVVAARPEAAGGQAHPVRRRAGRAARHRPRHLSVRDLVQHGRRRRRRPAPAWGRARSATCSASARPIRRGWGRGRSRPSRPTRSGASSASADANSAP